MFFRQNMPKNRIIPTDDASLTDFPSIKQIVIRRNSWPNYNLSVLFRDIRHIPHHIHISLILRLICTIFQVITSCVYLDHSVLIRILPVSHFP